MNQNRNNLDFKMKPYGREKKYKHFIGKNSNVPNKFRKSREPWWTNEIDVLPRTTIKFNVLKLAIDGIFEL